MRLLLRVLGTLLIAFAVILLIIDGTKSLGASALVFTSMGDTWTQIHAPSLEATKQFFTTRLLGPLLETVVTALLGLPGWAVVGVPGLLLAWAGRSRRVRVFVRQDQISAVSLHSIRVFRTFVTTLPAVTVVEQWGSHVAKVGGKVFALIAEDGSSIAFKVSEMSFEGLTSLDGIGQAPYFARGQWVSVARGALLKDAEIRAYLAAAHRIIAGKLTRKMRAELGLSEP